MYKHVNPKADFPKQEEDVLKFWEENDVFKKSVSQRDGATNYIFFDGPPFATGLPHFGHFVPCTIKDIIPRYKTMKGFRVERCFGWDCHGLPVENLLEKELGLNSKTEIEKYGVEKFNEACRASVFRYVKEWKQTITRLGRWVDFENDYKTMNPDFMESIWWVMKTLFDKGLLYEGHYILPYCPRCSTVLSNHELNLGGYKNVYDPAITVRFKVLSPIKNSIAGKTFANSFGSDQLPEDTCLLAWTTTPWTLPSNLALTMGAEIEYALIEYENAHYIIAVPRLDAYFKEEKTKGKTEETNSVEYKIIWKKKGAELEGLRYEPLFSYFKNLAANDDGLNTEKEQGTFRVLLGDFVTTEDGTGIVHTAPGFGEDDNRVCKTYRLPTVCPVDAECRFTNDVKDYVGLFVKDTDKQIIDRLKNEGKLFKRDQIFHSYPHCWRCSSPLIYRAVASWFVSVEKIKEQMLNANSQITWQPEHIKSGRFGKWLDGARDWAISRNRYWGNPIPIWKCPDCGEIICVGSRKELEELSGVYPEDMHKHFIDKITIKCKKCSGTMKRIPEVLDCWFESGSMPYAQQHYPFENKDKFEDNFPADFISEGIDQTRGWFYLLTVLAAALFDKPAFKNCIVNGLVLAEDGKKMSKSLRNYTDPNEVIKQFGADALRLFLMNSNVVKADDLKYSDDGVRDVLKGILIPFWNSYSFYVTYANIDGIVPPAEAKVDGKDPGIEVFLKTLNNPLDAWILSVTEKLVQDVTTSLDNYDLSQAIPPMIEYIDLLNNWYIRRSRRRFWKSENDSDKNQAYETLYRAIKKFSLIAAPVIPFITETIWQNLKTEKDALSIHLTEYPEYNEAVRNRDLEFKMKTVQKAVSMGRSLRYQFNLKIRQPLKAVEIVTRNTEEKKVLLEMEESIIDELNVKQVIFHEKEDELVEYSAKANFRMLGKELGSSMKKAAGIIEAMTSSEIQNILEGSTLSIDVDGKTTEITAEKIIVNRIEKASLKVVNDGTLTVGLDTELTEELIMEGYVRDLVRGIQNLRKECGLEVTDRIKLFVSYSGEASSSDALKKAFTMFKDYISEETLSTFADWVNQDVINSMQKNSTASVEAGEQVWQIGLEKAK